ncbi:hypothetical protein I7L49_02220 [Neisseria meningitidis]|nr:hypothetical protein [Neisseria meningitidis]MBH6132858.1 hypothetical protein [Neisseria meningitidis]
MFFYNTIQAQTSCEPMRRCPDAVPGFYSGLTKTSTALPRLSSKRTIL